MICPLCQNQLSEHKDPVYYLCHGCRALVKDERLYVSAQKEQARYEEHKNDVNDPRYQQFVSSITDYVLTHYTPEHQGLDFGCGTAPVITHVLQQQGYTLHLYDHYFYPDNSYLNHQYDYICSCEVFEHFHHPKIEIEKLIDLLKRGGRLIIKTHLYSDDIPFKNWYYRNDDTHVFIYTRGTIEHIAHTYDLDIEHLDARTIVWRKKS